MVLHTPRQFFKIIFIIFKIKTLNNSIFNNVSLTTFNILWGRCIGKICRVIVKCMYAFYNDYAYYTIGS